MKPTSIDLFQTLKTKMGEREANALINYMEKKLQDSNRELFQLCLNTFATKLELKEEIAKVREDLAKGGRPAGSQDRRSQIRRHPLDVRLFCRHADRHPGPIPAEVTTSPGRFVTHDLAPAPPHNAPVGTIALYTTVSSPAFNSNFAW
jgi:hypothetical protein